MRVLKREITADTLSDRLPLKITNYGESIAVVLSVEQYNQLVRQIKSNGNDSKQAVSQPKIYNIMDLRDYHFCQEHKGETVSVRQGKQVVKIVVKEIDFDGNIVPEV